jgi:protein tyrosine kinase modulator
VQEDISNTFNINHYKGLLWRRRYLVLSIALAVLSVMTWGSFLMPKVYEASATIMIEKSGLINPLIQGVGVSPTEDRLRKIKNTIMSRAVIENVTKKLGLDSAKIGSAQYDRIISGFLHRLKIDAKDTNDPDMFTIAYRGDDPKAVVTFVNTLVNEFINKSVLDQRLDAEGAFDFIDSQLAEYKKKLEESDRAAQQFRERNPTMIPQSESTLTGRIENFETARIDGEIRMKELRKKRENLQKQLTGEKELTIASVSGDGSPEGRLQQLTQQLMLLLTKYTEDYPDVIKVKSEIEELQKQISQATKGGMHASAQSASTGSETRALNPIYRQIKEELSKTDTEIESLQARMDELQRQQNQGRAILGKLPKEQEEWSKLQRDRAAYQRVYDELIQRREVSRVSKNLEMADKTAMFHVAEPPLMPRFPVSPNRIKLILLGLFLGIGAGVGAVVGLDYVDQSFKDEDSLQKGLRLPVLASIPTVVSEADSSATAKLDKKVLIAAAAYLAVVGLVFLGEVLYRYMGISVFRS